MKTESIQKPLLLRFFRWITPLQAQNLLVALFLMLVGNVTFIRNVVTVYPISEGNFLFVSSVVLLFWLVNALFFSLICYGRSARWVLATYVVVSSLAAYFMDRYGTVIDTTMIENMVQTNVNEAGDLFSWSLLARFVLLGLVPAFLIIKFAAKPKGLLLELRARLVFVSLLLLGMVALIVPFTSQYASFIREHKIVRFYSNPTYYTYSLIRYGGASFKTAAKLAPDPMINPAADGIRNSNNKKLVVLVVGETARADHFSLNGYARKTNPLLEKQDVVSFKKALSCGTTTAVSVPCMFSVLTSDEYSGSKGKRYFNVLDVLQNTGVQVLWRDNNSDSKGVADRVTFQNYLLPENNPDCDVECRDQGMLVGLDEYVAANQGKDLLIVLHSMGNHGPAYYKRYPKSFEKFKPICETNELSDCSDEQINNTYDNVILYTDHFLNEIIEFLKRYDATHETAMLYVSDHGESLGELGLYLHGAPMAFAPKEQTHVAVVAWSGKRFGFSNDQLKMLEDKPVSHDDLFCTLLLGFDVTTSACPDNAKLLSQKSR